MSDDIVEVCARAMERGVCKHCRRACEGEGAGHTPTCDRRGCEWAKPTPEEQARTALAALEAAGYAVVPVEPSEAMKVAGENAVDDGETYGCARKAESAYAAMLKASRVKAADVDGQG